MNAIGDPETRGPARRRAYPLGKVMGAVAPSVVDAVTVALLGTGIAPGDVEVVTADDETGDAAPGDGGGFQGMMERLSLGLGADLDTIEEARRELAAGHVIVLVPVNGDEGARRVGDILRAHGGHAVRYFGRWTIETLV